MFKCDSCGAEFAQPRIVRNGGGDVGEDWAVCPRCGGDAIDEGRRCEECGDFAGSNSLCDECLEKHINYDTVHAFAETERPEEVHLDALLAYIFSPSEINDILEREVREAYKNKGIYPKGAEITDSLIAEFARDCRPEFEDYITKNNL